MKKYTTKRTELPITILTDYEHRKGDLLESVRQQIEQSGFHLQTLFNNLKRSALFMEHYFDDSAPDEIRGFCSDLMNTADIGNGLCMNVWRAVSELTDLQMTGETAAESEPPIADSEINSENSVHKSDAETLAEKISYLMRSEDVPSPISGGLISVMLDFFNEEVDQPAFEDETSPDYLARLLKCSDYFTADGEKAEAETNENM